MEASVARQLTKRQRDSADADLSSKMHPENKLSGILERNGEITSGHSER